VPFLAALLPFVWAYYHRKSQLKVMYVVEQPRDAMELTNYLVGNKDSTFSSSSFPHDVRAHLGDSVGHSFCCPNVVYGCGSFLKGNVECVVTDTLSDVHALSQTYVPDLIVYDTRYGDVPPQSDRWSFLKCNPLVFNFPRNQRQPQKHEEEEEVIKISFASRRPPQEVTTTHAITACSLSLPTQLSMTTNVSKWHGELYHFLIRVGSVQQRSTKNTDLSGCAAVLYSMESNERKQGWKWEDIYVNVDHNSPATAAYHALYLGIKLLLIPFLCREIADRPDTMFTVEIKCDCCSLVDDVMYGTVCDASGETFVRDTQYWIRYAQYISSLNGCGLKYGFTYVPPASNYVAQQLSCDVIDEYDKNQP
jgi:predicted small lipoprotein YifL